MKWVDPNKVQLWLEVVDDFGHKNTLEEIEAQAEEMWGKIDNMEEEGSIPWHRVVRCPNLNGFHLQNITTQWLDDNCKVRN